MNQEFHSGFRAQFENLLESGWYIMGPQLKEFEENFTKYCGAKFGLGVGTGLDAIRIGLQALGIGVGDEVIVPANSFIASALAVTQAGATPVLVEPCEETFNLKIESVEKAITDKTKAVLHVHLYGQVSDLDSMMQFCESKKIFLIEDAAQAHGAMFKGKKAGNWGHLAAFSFYPGKNLGALGDGGFVTTNSREIYEQVKSLRNYGSLEKYHHDTKGHNSRLDEVQAGFLNLKLEKLDESNNCRRNIAKRYLEEIKNEYISLPKIIDFEAHSFHLFVIRTKYRKALVEYLNEKQISTVIHYPIPIHKMGAYSEFNHLQLPISEALAAEVLSLPLSPNLTKEEVDFVVDIVNGFEVEK